MLPAGPALLEFILLTRAPESAPWSLVVKGPEAAKAAHTDLYERWSSTTIPPYEPQSEKLPGVASWAECRYWWPAAVAFVMQSFLTFFTGGFTLFIFVVEIMEKAGGSRRAAGVIVVLFGVAKLLATLGVVTACVEIKILRRVHAIDAMPARWRGDAGSSPPDTLVDFHTGRRD